MNPVARAESPNRPHNRGRTRHAASLDRDASGGSQLPVTEGEFTGCKRYPENKRFRLTVRGEVALTDLIPLVSGIGCHTILLGQQVAARGGKVQIEAPDLVTAPEVFRIFTASLDANGLTIERAGALWKIVDAAKGKEIAPILASGERAPAGEEFVTQLVRLKSAALSDVADVLGKMHSRDGEVISYPPGRALIITDHADTVRRMRDLVRALDVAEPNSRIFTLAVHTQSATELAAAIDKVLQATRRSPATSGGGAATDKAGGGGGAKGTDGATLVPVDAARMVVVVGDEGAFRRVSALAQRIDPAVDGDGAGQSRVHVIYLAHTNADEMSNTLKELGLVGKVAAPAAHAGAAASGAVPLQGDVRISADKVSNSIVVFASSADFAMVRDLVTRLDVPRRQVYVEAAILDISVDRAHKLGLSAHGLGDAGGGSTVIGSTSSSSLSSVTTDAASLASLFTSGGLTTGVFGQSFNIAGVSIPSFGVVLKALQTSKNVNVISQPHLLTMDNVKASLSVGQSIPFQVSSLGALASTAVASTSLLSSYQRQDVALKLELTPHLNDSESIRLELDGEISDVPDGQSTSAPGGPTTNKRTLKTSVVVNDGETVVLGGLQKETESEMVDKVPILGDIPILGRLFQYKAKSRSKQDLLIAITPYVIRGPADLRRIFERKQAEQREFAVRFDNQHPQYDPPHDWQRRRGLLEEINVTAKQAAHEAELLREAGEGTRQAPPDGEVSDARMGGDAASAAGAPTVRAEDREARRGSSEDAR